MSEPSDRDRDLWMRFQIWSGDPKTRFLELIAAVRAEECERCAKIVEDAGPECDFVAKRIRGGE